MKKFFLAFGLVLSFFLVGCSSTYCDNHFPADMDAFVPDLRGRTFVYTNQESDTIGLYEYDYFVQPDEVLEACSKCSCEGPFKALSFKLSPAVEGDGKFQVICQSCNVAEKYWNLYVSGFYFNGINGFYRQVQAKFDEQGHFTQRDFGDTIVLKSYSPGTDTAIWVAGFGFTCLGDYHLVSVTDSTGAVLYSAEAR